MKLKYEDGVMAGYVKDWVMVVTIFLAVLLFLIGSLVGAMAGNNHSAHVDCLRLSEETGRATKTVGVVDVTCFILVPRLGWVRSDLYRGVVVPV